MVQVEAEVRATRLAIIWWTSNVVDAPPERKREDAGASPGSLSYNRY